MNPIHAQDTANTTGADSPTPRTDAARLDWNQVLPGNIVVLVSHARALERELTEARAQLATSRSLAQTYHDSFNALCDEATTLRAQLAAAQKDLHLAHNGLDERDRLRDKLAALEADKARLDWLAHNPLVFGMVTIPCPDGRPECLVHHQRRQNAEEIRAAIDAALTATKEAKP